ncbi:hypothetical protein MZM54_04975 [[Brevibacterium] frigoritolerans]|nr:hypothetical protein [Peribacillus frigoritolerans]
MEINGVTIIIKDIEQKLLNKTPFSEKGIKNVMKSIASDFLADKNDFFVHIQSNGNTFHIKREKLSDDTLAIGLKDIYIADLYINSGLKSENITRKDIKQLLN